MIETLMKVLPDSIRDDDNCWDWCWEELHDKAQMEVQEARAKAVRWLEEHVGEVPK